jgi:putative DNA primase/helicase
MIHGGHSESNGGDDGGPRDPDDATADPSWPRPKPRPWPRDLPEDHTDAANGRQFAFMHGGHLKHVADVGRWLRWDGKRWAQALEGDLLQAAKAVAEGLLGHAARQQNEEAQKAARTWAIKSANLPRLNAMITVGASEDDVRIEAKVLDHDPYMLNVENGTVDLMRAKLNPSDRSDFITRIVPVTYDPDAMCPRWWQFLSEVFDGDEELIAFVQRAVGYTLTGDTREHALFLLWGNGCNGKSVFIETLRAILGEFAVATPMSTFTTKRDGSTPTNDLAMLRGARLCTVQESEETAGFSESLVKSLTGGDAITARFLHREFFTYMPQFKPWIATNHKPRVRGTDDGFWRRVRLIPFTVSFLNRQDKTLLATLRAELAGILNWAIDGCVAWQLHGLGAAKAVTAATSTYREESDALAQFVADRLLVTGDPDMSITSKRLYELYARWCEENGEKARTQRFVGEYLFKLDGISPYRTKVERGYQGVGEGA